jgi:hypothetical protein
MTTSQQVLDAYLSPYERMYGHRYFRFATKHAGSDLFTMALVHGRAFASPYQSTISYEGKRYHGLADTPDNLLTMLDQTQACTCRDCAGRK